MRAWIRKVLSVRDSPEALARGLAIGFFFGVSVCWGLQALLAVGGAWLLRGNKVVAAAMTAVSNPLTSLPLYGACLAVGRVLVGGDGALPDLAALRSLDALAALGPGLLRAMLAGTTAVGLVGGAALYVGAGRLLPALRRRRGRPLASPGE